VVMSGSHHMVGKVPSGSYVRINSWSRGQWSHSKQRPIKSDRLGTILCNELSCGDRSEEFSYGAEALFSASTIP
jgi:hypothetical protein